MVDENCGDDLNKVDDMIMVTMILIVIMKTYDFTGFVSPKDWWHLRPC